MGLIEFLTRSTNVLSWIHERCDFMFHDAMEKGLVSLWIKEDEDNHGEIGQKKVISFFQNGAQSTC